MRRKSLAIERLAVALAGAMLAGACAHAAEADALAISANIQARHLPFGTIIDPVFASAGSDQIVAYTRCGDSAIWTGHYLAAEAFRYKVTRSPDALNNASKAIAGIKLLVDVTGTDVLARCAVPMGSPFAASIQGEESHNGIFTNSAAGFLWAGNTSRDQYSGVLFGLAVAYDMVDDPAVKASASLLATRLIDFLKGHGWNVVLPDGSISTTFLIRPDQILTFLQIGQHVNPTHFSTSYDESRLALAAQVTIPIGLEVLNDDSYFKFNLDSINLYNLVRLENGSSRGVYERAYDLLRNHTAGHQNAFFDAIDLGLKGPNSTRDVELLALLDAWLQRQRRDRSLDLHGTVAVCGSQACRPVPVPLRPPTDFLWQRSPFQLAGGGSGTIETAGIDYILPYWMARSYGLGAAFRVQSAASNSSTVAPNSIASIFGSNVASQTAQASARPLPLTLGGIAVLVRDSAGTLRNAPLYYVSPGQINFIVPNGTSPGVATLTVVNGSTSSVGVANIEDVAPTLFSMNGNGMGVAAATAIRTLAGNPGSQSPVPVFQCDSSGCVPVPIDLGLDTPVFLSLYGTGIRNRSSLANVKVTINGVSVPVLYAGAQPQFDGLDQVNVGLTLNLRGSGVSNVVVTVDGKDSNAVIISLSPR